MGYLAPATPDHARALCPLLRPADRAEVHASVGLPPELVLPDMVGPGREAWAMFTSDHEIAGLFGVDPVFNHPHIGVIWLLGSDQLQAHSVEFLRKSREWVDIYNQRYTLLLNRADARNTLHLRWLRWLGFTLIREAPWGAEGRPFVEFARLQPCAYPFSLPSAQP